MEIEIKKNYYDEEKTKIYLIIYHKKGDDDFWHREDGPARQLIRHNGCLYYESYYINDKIHREDGPAVIWYDENGVIENQDYYLNGKELSEKEFKMKMRLKGTLLEGKY